MTGYTVFVPYIVANGNGDQAPGPQRQAVLDLVNRQRLDHGLPPLTWNQDLGRAAQSHAEDMAANGYFGHDSPGKTWAERIVGFYRDWKALGEIIAAGYTTPQQVVKGWMGSPGHKAIILGKNFTEAGVGHATGGPYGHYWVVDFGDRT